MNVQKDLTSISNYEAKITFFKASRYGQTNALGHTPGLITCYIMVAYFSSGRPPFYFVVPTTQVVQSLTQTHTHAHTFDGTNNKH